MPAKGQTCIHSWSSPASLFLLSLQMDKRNWDPRRVTTSAAVKGKQQYDQDHAASGRTKLELPSLPTSKVHTLSEACFCGCHICACRKNAGLVPSLFHTSALKLFAIIVSPPFVALTLTSSPSHVFCHQTQALSPLNFWIIFFFASFNSIMCHPLEWAAQDQTQYFQCTPPLSEYL